MPLTLCYNSNIKQSLSQIIIERDRTMLTLTLVCPEDLSFSEVRSKRPGSKVIKLTGELAWRIHIFTNASLIYLALALVKLQN